MGKLFRNGLQHIPMLHHFPIRIEAEDVDAGIVMVCRPSLKAMQDDEVAFHIHPYLDGPFPHDLVNKFPHRDRVDRYDLTDETVDLRHDEVAAKDQA